ncbi:MAG: iron ABC transporter permease [Bacteroidia bacterium]|nr:iron ABC transporter permease [Bacteroidia bacterium]
MNDAAYRNYQANKAGKITLLFVILSVICIILFFSDLLIGPVSIPIKETFRILFYHESSSNDWLSIVLEFRLPRVLAAMFAGAALSVSGLKMQTFFRNPLAGPDVLGISAGASFGVALLILGIPAFLPLDFFSSAGRWSVVTASWLGSGSVLFFLLFVSLRVRDIRTILILGILFSSSVYAIVSLLQYFSGESMLKSFVVWTMGSLGNVTSNQLFVMIPSITSGLLISYFLSKYLDVIQLGDNYSSTLGLNLKWIRLLIFASTSILTGTVTAFCGPIGFVGIAVPHISRALFRTSGHSILIPGTALAGAVILLTGDIITKLPGSENNLPINAVTALLGIPVVIWVIIKNRKFG